MTYLEIKDILTYEYANYSYNYILRKRLGADELYPINKVLFLKTLYKSLMNQDGDEDTDGITKIDIQKMIRLFNIYCHSTIQIEYE